MSSTFQAILEIQPEDLSLWIWVVGAGVLLAGGFFVVRRWMCSTRGHDFEEIDAVPTVVIYRCRRCGVKKYDSKNAA